MNPEKGLKMGAVAWACGTTIFAVGVAWATQVTDNKTQDTKIKLMTVSVEKNTAISLKNREDIAVIKNDINHIRESNEKQERLLERILQNIED